MHPLCYSLPPEKLLIYKFPNDFETFIKLAETEPDELAERGWIEPGIVGQYFTAWLHQTKVQLCKVDILTLKTEKPSRGLNTDTPFLYSLQARDKDDLPYVVVTTDVMNAIAFNGLGINAVATGSASPTKHQIGHLAKLNCPLIMVTNADKKSEQACELFVRHLARYTETRICLVNDWDKVFRSNQSKDDLEAASIDGIEFLVRRIQSKHNGKDEYSRSLDIIEAANAVGNKNHNKLISLAKSAGLSEFAHFSESLHLMADLINAELSVESAREIVQKRYGVSIFVRQVQHAKLI